MHALIRILRANRNETLLDEDGDNLVVELREGVAIEEILKFERSHGIELPEDLKELLLFSNGVHLFGLDIFSLDEVAYFPNSGILSFHSWGNGDFDCISVGGDYPKGTVVFMAHSEDHTSVVCNNLVAWFEGVIIEVKERGTLLHPMDYKEWEAEGMYQKISYN
jgi:hypothetical protein